MLCVSRKRNNLIKDTRGVCESLKYWLDVIFQHGVGVIRQRIFGIDAENMAKQINLTYTRLFEEAVEAVRTDKAQCAFILNPTRVTEIRDVATAGEKMPQKSTYFYPKLITGLVMNKLF